MFFADINFQTPNLIIACYKQGAGGKFLLNAIGLSKGAVLQDADLARQQLIGQLSSDHKLNLLMSRIKDNDPGINDLGLGCFKLFGIPSSDYFTKFTSVPSETFDFDPVIETLSKSDLKFCLVSHLHTLLLKQLEVWPNANLIFFKNQDNFISQYRTAYRRDVRQTELRSMSIVQEQENSVEEKILSSKKCLTWDCDWFLDHDATMHGVQELYQSLNLDDFNVDYVSTFYKAWIERVKTSPQLDPGSEYARRIRWNI